MQAAIYAQRQSEFTYKIDNYTQKINGLVATIAKAKADETGYRDRLGVAEAHLSDMRRDLEGAEPGPHGAAQVVQRPLVRALIAEPSVELRTVGVPVLEARDQARPTSLANLGGLEHALTGRLGDRGLDDLDRGRDQRNDVLALLLGASGGDGPSARLEVQLAPAHAAYFTAASAGQDQQPHDPAIRLVIRAG